jgi:amino acid permease
MSDSGEPYKQVYDDDDDDEVASLVPRATENDAVVNLSKAMLGAASFELPWALDQSGLWSGLLSMALFGVVSAHTLKLLARCRKVSRNHNSSYEDLGREAYGENGAAMVTFAVVSMSLGVCAAYLVFVASQLQRLFQDVWDVSQMTVSVSPDLLPMLLIAPIAIGLSQVGAPARHPPPPPRARMRTCKQC